jgi:hypothetical protein
MKMKLLYILELNFCLGEKTKILTPFSCTTSKSCSKDAPKPEMKQFLLAYLCTDQLSGDFLNRFFFAKPSLKSYSFLFEITKYLN